MLLIWLLLPVVRAILDCRSVCDLCQMGTDPPTIQTSCDLCRNCQWVLNPRRMMQLQLGNKHNLLMEGTVLFPDKHKILLSDQQKEELKNLELNEFRQMMKEYGLRPEELVDEGNTNVSEGDCIPEPVKCLGDTEENEAEEAIKKLVYVPSTPTKPTCAPVPITCATSSVTPRYCPPIKPCKKKLEGHDVSSLLTLSKERRRILKQLERLEATEADETGCPTQPICSDEDSDKEQKLNYKVTPPLTSSTPERPSTETTRPRPPPCVPCLPPCPCGPVPLFLPLSLPLSLQALIPQTITQQVTDTHTTEKATTYNKQHEMSDEEVSIEKWIFKKTTKAKKDNYLYLYVGVPKDVKIVRKG